MIAIKSKIKEMPINCLKCEIRTRCGFALPMYTFYNNDKDAIDKEKDMRSEHCPLVEIKEEPTKSLFTESERDIIKAIKFLYSEYDIIELNPFNTDIYLRKSISNGENGITLKNIVLPSLIEETKDAYAKYDYETRGFSIEYLLNTQIEN